MLVRLDCWAVGGLFMGFAIECDPNPCGVADAPEEQAEPGESLNWGRIKSRYRD
jgi:hypothetical protein